MRQEKILIANWKMNFSVVQAVQFLHKLRDQLQFSSVPIILCAPFTTLSALRYELQKGAGTFAVQLRPNIFLGAQNLHYETHGAFTGELSPAMVKELAQYVLIGHSERRHHSHETDAVIHKKVVAAHTVGLTPILCVGAFVGQKKEIVSQFVEKELEQQLRDCLTGLSFQNKEKLVLAYEPDGSISTVGTGQAATDKAADPKRMGHICFFIRRQLQQMFGETVAEQIPIIYGGSITSTNVKSFLQEKEIDGFLVGNASLDVEEFVRIVKCV